MNKFFYYLFLVSALSGFCLQNTFAESSEDIATAYKAYQAGAYEQAFQILDKIATDDSKTRATIAFWKGVCQSRLQNFQQATDQFHNAYRLGYNEADLYYEAGQAAYALRQYDNARRMFVKSAQLNYKVGASRYYIAYSSQLLEDYHNAFLYYNKILNFSDDDEKVKQIALYQIAEINYSKIPANYPAQKKDTLFIQILEQYQRAIDYDSSSVVAREAKARIQEIEQKRLSIMPRMRNGIPIPKKSYTWEVSQEISYDSNVTTQADASLSPTNKASFAYKASIFTRYQFNYKNAWSFLPEMNMYYLRYLHRLDPEIYQNDTLDFNPALRTRLEHFINSRPASALFELEYDYQRRDVYELKHLNYYNRSYNFILGERSQIFGKIGSATVKGNIKFSENYLKDDNAIIPGVSLGYNFPLWRTYSLNLFSSADWYRYNYNYNDQNVYSLRTNFNMVGIAENMDFNPSLNISLTDTMQQRPTRGNELNISPTLSLVRHLGEHWDLQLDYNYTKNYSKDTENYQYTKHIARFDLTAKF